MRLSGKNFQPWSEFDLDIHGLTILVGPSNEGKSSIFRALRGILRNEIDTADIRDPKEEPLLLELESGQHKISATRSKKGSVKYTIDGEPYAKLAGDVPPLVQDLKFTDIKIGDFSFDPIFGEQNSSQFLIDSRAFKPNEINAILGAFGGTEKLEHGKKEANLRKTQKDSEARTLAAQIREAEDRKARLQLLMTESEEFTRQVKSLEDGIRWLDSEVSWYDEAYQCVRRLQPLHEIVEALVLPDISGVQEILRQTTFAEQAADSMRYASWLNKPLTVVEKISKSWSEIVRLWKAIGVIDAAQALPPTTNTEDLKALDLSTTLNPLLDLHSGIKHLETVLELQGALTASDIKLVEVETQLAEAQTEASKGLCPKCGGPLQHICAGARHGV